MSLTRAGQVLSTGLGVASWGRWFAAMGVVAAIAASVAFGMGVRWQQGAQALSEVKQQRAELQAKNAELADLRQAAADIKQAGLTAASQYREAAQRQGDIADAWHRFQSENSRWFVQHGKELDALLGQLPAGVAGCDGGDGVRDHWNRASQPRSTGDAGTDPDAVDPRGAAGAVRRDAGRTGRPLRDAGAHARCGDGTASRLRREGQRADPRGEGDAGHRMAVVLRGSDQGRLRRA